MKTTSLPEFKDFAKNGVAYIPIGTIEWHGNVLPIETDFLVAQYLCEELKKTYPGYVLPPFYMGAYGRETIDGVEMRGMDRKLKKKLAGQVFFLENDLLIQVLTSLINNLKDQGFNKIIIVTGHGGGHQTAVLEELAKIDNVLTINPYESVQSHHADEGEISIIWAIDPSEEAKATKDQNIIDYYGYDPLTKSSIEYGQELLNKMLNFAKEKVGEFLKGE